MLLIVFLTVKIARPFGYLAVHFFKYISSYHLSGHGLS